MTRHRLLTTLSLIACLFASGVVRAGSDMFGSLPGEMKASTTTPAAGETVAVTLQVTPGASVRGLKLTFDAPDGCAVLQASSAKRADVSLTAGHPALFATKARVASAKPCKIVASVVQTDGADARTGWVYAIVLNDQPVRHPAQTPGRDAEGRPTIDAVGR